jgi:hypothetical protein
MPNEDILWGTVHNEHLHCTDPNDAIAELLESCEFRYMQSTTVVHEYMRCQIDPKDYADMLVSTLLDALDCDYSNPEDRDTQSSPNMLAAAETFVEKVLEEYHVWTCELTGKKHMVSTWKWIEEHRPEWICEARAKGELPDGFDK